jgi:hypothetical protein
MTAVEIAKHYAKNNPGIRFAASKCGSAVGIYVPEKGRFVEFVMKTISPTVPWVNLMDESGSIRTTTCNGKPLYNPEDWEECNG